jgi:hypothetical protein
METFAQCPASSEFRRLVPLSLWEWVGVRVVRATIPKFRKGLIMGEHFE